jgi:hypothetical protein
MVGRVLRFVGSSRMAVMALPEQNYEACGRTPSRVRSCPQRVRGSRRGSRSTKKAPGGKNGGEAGIRNLGLSQISAGGEPRDAANRKFEDAKRTRYQ